MRWGDVQLQKNKPGGLNNWSSTSVKRGQKRFKLMEAKKDPVNKIFAQKTPEKIKNSNAFFDIEVTSNNL